MTLPNGIARCAGVGFTEDDGIFYWREGCDDCLRRTATFESDCAPIIEAPFFVPFECEYRIDPNVYR